MTQVGVVLVGHGSRGDNANDGMLEVGEALRKGGKFRAVEVGFMQRNFPTIEEAVNGCLTAGAETVLLIPYFLHTGLHLQRDLPEKVRLLRALHPGIRFGMGKPLAHHQKLVDIVLDRIEACQTDVVKAGDKESKIEAAREKPFPPKRALRKGYTTGACAAAAAKAAAEVLLAQKRVMQVDIPLPMGQRASFLVGRCEIGPNQARCSVMKDAGDDPDVTDRAEICATVSWQETSGITIEGGEGVGVVTKPGLGLPVGAAAINPVPCQMIQTAVTEALGPSLSERGVQVVISVPAGKAIARKTLNERLGIVGGLSILGTTGIVVPFSTSAYKACISQALGVASAVGCRQVVLTSGRRTERFAQARLSLPEEAFIQVGDFLGFALEECVRHGVPRATLCLLIGKLSKLAAGHLQTHVSESRVEPAFLAQVAAECGADPTTVRLMSEMNTSREFAETVCARGIRRVFDRLCQMAAETCRAHVQGKLAIECFLTDFNGSILGSSRVDE